MNKSIFSKSSDEVDQYFGYQVTQIEQNLYHRAKSLRPEGNLANLSQVLHDGNQTWVGLEPQILLTPYEELIQICELLNPKDDELLIDLGAGYGRMGLVLHYLKPEVKFVGYELVKERVEEGNRIFAKYNCTNSSLKVQDLTAADFVLPLAQYYFLYDYGKVHHIRETLKELEKFAWNASFKVIARGKGSRSIIENEHPWLSQINPVIREENFSIYSF